MRYEVAENRSAINKMVGQKIDAQCKSYTMRLMRIICFKGSDYLIKNHFL